MIPAAFLACRERLWRKGQKTTLPHALSRFLTAKMAFVKGGNNKDSIKQFLWPWLGSGNRIQYGAVEMGLSGLSFAMLGIANAWVLTGLGEDVHWLPVLMVVILAYFGGSVLGVMGGIGVTEVFLLKLYPLVGISQTHAAAGALLHRALFYAVCRDSRRLGVSQSQERQPQKLNQCSLVSGVFLNLFDRVALSRFMARLRPRSTPKAHCSRLLDTVLPLGERFLYLGGSLARSKTLRLVLRTLRISLMLFWRTASSNKPRWRPLVMPALV